jgi:ABC-type phosphate transport system substrate-binding protein
LSARRRFLVRRLLLAALPLLLLALPVRAELVVVVSPHSDITSLTREQVINIYMGRYRVLPDGSTAHPLDAAADSAERGLFYRGLLGKSLDDVNAYWARLVFSGRTAPPREVPNRQAMLADIADDRNAIGYVERKDLTRNLKIVFSFPE